MRRAAMLMPRLVFRDFLERNLGHDEYLRLILMRRHPLLSPEETRTKLVSIEDMIDWDVLGSNTLLRQGYYAPQRVETRHVGMQV
jgi:hypothetical protein